MSRDTWLDHYDAACARAVRAAHAQRLANMPLRPKVDQQPAHTLRGLFGDEHTQIDLLDAISDRHPCGCHKRINPLICPVHTKVGKRKD